MFSFSISLLVMVCPIFARIGDSWPQSALRTQLRADDWRAKKEGLDAVAECLKRANHRIAANVGDLCAALKPSLINNNKALVLGMGRLAFGSEMAGRGTRASRQHKSGICFESSIIPVEHESISVLSDLLESSQSLLEFASQRSIIILVLCPHIVPSPFPFPRRHYRSRARTDGDARGRSRAGRMQGAGATPVGAAARERGQQ